MAAGMARSKSDFATEEEPSNASPISSTGKCHITKPKSIQERIKDATKGLEAAMGHRSYKNIKCAYEIFTNPEIKEYLDLMRRACGKSLKLKAPVAHPGGFSCVEA